MIIRPPLPLKAGAVAGADPELGLLEMNRDGTGVHRLLDALAEKLAEVFARRHVIDVATMRDHVAVAVGLGLVDVIGSVKSAVEIILVMTPRNAGHQVRDVTLGFPLGDPSRERIVHAVTDRHVGTKLEFFVPVSGLGLKTRRAPVPERDRAAATVPAVCRRRRSRLARVRFPKRSRQVTGTPASRIGHGEAPGPGRATAQAVLPPT